MTGKRRHAVAQRRLEAADRGADRHGVVSSPPRSSSPTTGSDAILQLQALAGNRAVADLMEVVAQRAQAQAEITDADVAAMTSTRRLVVAFERAEISLAVRDKILSALSPEALVGAIIAFAALFVASQFTPVGWAADLLTAVFVGSAVVTAFMHLVNFAAARKATTRAELDQAAGEFAAAVAEIEVDAFILLLTHRIGGPGGRPYDGPPPSKGLVLATPGGGAYVVPVVVDTIPANVAAQIGLLAGGTSSSLSMMAANDGKGGPTGGSRSGDSPSKGSGAPEQAPAEGGWDRDAILEEFEEAQQKVGTGAYEKDVLEQPGVSDRRTPGGRPQPRATEVGNFGHMYAEQLIPESEMPRSLDKEVPLTDRGQPVGRPDRVDWKNGIFYEVKPKTAKRTAEGWEQVRRYIYYLNKMHPLGNGRSWQGRVVTYDYATARRILFGK
jgi:hypothetical protein